MELRQKNKRLEGTESEFTRENFITVPEAEDKLEDHITTLQPVLRLETVLGTVQVRT